MIQQQIEQIQAKLENASGLSPENRSDLLNLLADLKAQVEMLSQTNEEGARSVTTFAHASAHEATRPDKNPQELESALEGLTTSVVGLESSHPKLAEVVNRIAVVLSNMGI